MGSLHDVPNIVSYMLLVLRIVPQSNPIPHKPLSVTAYVLRIVA